MITESDVRLYSVKQLAEMWGVSPRFVYREIEGKRLPIVQLSNGDRDKTRVRAADAAAWVEGRRVAI